MIRNRIVTLASDNRLLNHHFVIIRRAGGAFSMDIKKGATTSKTLARYQGAEVYYRWGIA